MGLSSGRPSRALILLAVLALLVPVACSRSSVVAPTPARAAADADCDGVPDEVEKAVGADPTSRDTDGDGLTDYQELVESARRAGKIAAAKDGQSFFRVAPAYAADTKPDWGAVKKAAYDSDGKAPADVLDGWKHNLTYALEGDIVQSVHRAVLAKNPTWWVSATPDATAYAAAFLGVLQDEANTPAPLIDTDPPVAPDLPAGFTQAQAVQAWTGIKYEAKLWTGFLDDDGDGLPNAWETYGYRVVQDSSGHKVLQPWGIQVVGKAQYRYEGGNGPFDKLLPRPTDQDTVPAIVGAKTVVLAKPDYTKPYFKTAAGRKLSDGDPDTDYDEAFGNEGTQGSRPPYSSPVVGAFPEMQIEISAVTVTAKQDITDTNGGTLMSKDQSTAQTVAKHLPGFLRAPLQRVPGFKPSAEASLRGEADEGDEAEAGSA